MQLQQAYNQFQEQGAEVVALAVNTQQAVEQAQLAVQAAFPMLADPDYQVAEAYAVFNLLGDGLAAPAVFIIDMDGVVRWSYVGRDARDRPAVEDVLAQLP